MPSVRLLGPADLPAIDAFLRRHADSSLFLRSNLRTAGIVDRGEPFQGTYFGAFDGAELVGVAAHCWNGNVIVQAPAALDDAVCAAVEATGRGVRGIVGPWDQLCAARRALAMEDRPARMESHDRLFALALADLARPAVLDAPGVRGRAATIGDLDLVTRWRVAYCVEILGATEGDALRAESREDMRRMCDASLAWLIEQDGGPVSFSGFNARLADVVQIGGVFTPPALRSRGWARAAVASQLAAVVGEGVSRAILFTGEDPAAQRAYTAIGFRPIGDYGLLLF
jgi:uncharacterized protein